MNLLNHMVERIDVTFAALADPTRRAMLAALSTGEQSVGELGRPFAMSFAGAAKHIGVLERAGLVERRKAGRRILCRLRAEPLREANDYLRQWESFWTQRLDRFEQLIREERHAPSKESDDV